MTNDQLERVSGKAYIIDMSTSPDDNLARVPSRLTVALRSLTQEINIFQHKLRVFRLLAMSD